jgi:hypothetical protein
MVFCVGPIKYIGQDAYREDIANLKAALQGVSGVEGYLPAVAPGTMEHWMYNEYYKTDEEFLFAIADAMAEEYKAITDAGFILQIDDPDLPDGWQMYPDMTVPEYRKYADLRVEALNQALKNVPRQLVRFHTCWGSQHGPHMDDIPLKDFVDIMFKIKAECYSVEAANPQHDADFHVFETVKLPEVPRLASSARLMRSTPAGGGGPSDPLRQPHGQRAGDRRDGLRHGLARRPPGSVLGEVQRDGRGLEDRDEDALGYVAGQQVSTRGPVQATGPLPLATGIKRRL